MHQLDRDLCRDQRMEKGTGCRRSCNRQRMPTIRVSIGMDPSVSTQIPVSHSPGPKNQPYLIIIAAFTSEWNSSWVERFPDERALWVRNNGLDVLCSGGLQSQHPFRELSRYVLDCCRQRLTPGVVLEDPEITNCLYINESR